MIIDPRIYRKHFLSHVLQVTSTASDPDLGFTIISCQVSPNSNPNMISSYPLIETVCPTDDSVKFHPQRGLKKSFSFTFNSKFNMSLLFLHCEMSLCSRTSQSNQRLPLVCRVIFNDFTVAVFVSLEAHSGVLFEQRSVLLVSIFTLAALTHSAAKAQHAENPEQNKHPSYPSADSIV